MAATRDANGQADGGQVDVAILTVLPAALAAALAAIGIHPSGREEGDDGAVYYRGALPSSVADREYPWVLTSIGGAGSSDAGNASAAAASVIARYRPRTLLLVGLAAGVRGKVKIGDVVLSERVAASEPASLVRSASGTRGEPRHEIDGALYAMMRDVVSYRADHQRLRAAFLRAGGVFPSASEGQEDEFREHVAGSVAVRLGTIASGEKLLRDPATLLSLREEAQGTNETGETETAGVVEACRRANVPWLVVRGISDFGDELADDRFHGFAARAAAAAAVDFLMHGLDLGPRMVLRSSLGLHDFAHPPPNPFVFGRPIDREQDFLGREQELSWIRDAVERGQPVQLLGESLMGKTSLLRWVQRNLLLDRPVIWVDPTRGLTPAAMVTAIARALGKAEAAAALGRPEATADEAAGVLDALVPLVLLIDDADALAERGKGFEVGFFGAVRALVQERKITWLSASRRNLFELFRGKGLISEFLNDALKIRVGPLDAEAARTLAARGAAQEAARVLEEAGGFAYGLQWLGDYLYRRPGPIDPACDAFRDEVEAVFQTWWGGLEVEDRQLLRGCVVGDVTVEGLESKARRRLRRLVERGVVAEREGRFVVDGAAWRGFVGDAG